MTILGALQEAGREAESGGRHRHASQAERQDLLHVTGSLDATFTMTL
jgi:hypothetical protein